MPFLNHELPHANPRSLSFSLFSSLSLFVIFFFSFFSNLCPSRNKSNRFSSFRCSFFFQSPTPMVAGIRIPFDGFIPSSFNFSSSSSFLSHLFKPLIPKSRTSRRMCFMPNFESAFALRLFASSLSSSSLCPFLFLFFLFLSSFSSSSSSRTIRFVSDAMNRFISRFTFILFVLVLFSAAVVTAFPLDEKIPPPSRAPATTRFPSNANTFAAEELVVVVVVVVVAFIFLSSFLVVVASSFASSSKSNFSSLIFFPSLFFFFFFFFILFSSSREETIAAAAASSGTSSNMDMNRSPCFSRSRDVFVDIVCYFSPFSENTLGMGEFSPKVFFLF